MSALSLLTIETVTNSKNQSTTRMAKEFIDITNMMLMVTRSIENVLMLMDRAT